MKYAIIQSGSRQYKVKEGDELLLEKVEGKDGDSITFEEVLMIVDGEKRSIGQPKVNNASVSGKIISRVKGKKIRVATYKAKSRYRKVKGHRQQYSKVKIEKIKVGSMSKKSSVKSKTKTSKNKAQ